MADGFPNQMTRQDSEEDHAAEYARVASVLMEYGGVIAPFMYGGEWRVLVELADEVVASPPVDDHARRDVERRFDEVLGNPAFHPNYRAHLVSRSISLPHLSRCSHFLERAALHYYKRDFFSCVLVLLPAVEGVLRSYAGWAPGQAEPNWHAVRDAIRRGQAASYPELRAGYAEAICAFHERWFWKRTDTADFRLSHLNRHYALHGLGTGSFYRATDCHRLFLYFDTFADMLMLDGHGPTHVFLPTEEPSVRRRSDYYFSLLHNVWATQEGADFEEGLLREHPNFVVELNPPNADEMFARFDRIMGVGEQPKRRRRSLLERLRARFVRIGVKRKPK